MIATQNSIMHLLIGKDVARTASATAADPTASTYLADGEIAVVDMSGTVLNTTTVQVVDRVRIIQSQGATLPSIQSPVIELSGVKTYKSKAYTAPTVQIDYIGYNAVTATGDIDVINDNGYEIMIHDLNSAAYGSTGVDKFGFYVSDSSATKAEINDAIAINLYQNTTRVVRKPFIVERVSSDAGAAITGTATTWTVTNGLTTITANGTITNVSVGDYVRLGGTSTSFALYKVTAITSGASSSVTIDMPYQGASATLTEASAVEVITAALYVAGSVGIRLTGQAAVFVSPQSTEYYVNRWIVVLRNFGSTTTTNAQGGTEGVGSYPEVASLEYFLIGNEGFIERNNIPYINPRANALSTGTYHFLTLEWDSVKTGHIFNQQANSKQLLLAFNFVAGSAPTSVAGAVTSVQDVLNQWISSAIGTGTLA